jgi:hypothetical protein
VDESNALITNRNRARERIRARRPGAAFLQSGFVSDSSGSQTLSPSELERQIREFFKKPVNPDIPPSLSQRAAASE